MTSTKERPRLETKTERRPAAGEVDTDPRCQHCGKKQGEYFGVPWSIKCRNCGQQATRG